jgi:alpha-galactosidase
MVMMIPKFLSSLLAMIIALISGHPYYLQPNTYTEDETHMATYQEYHSFIDNPANLPVSFDYGRQHYKGLGGFTETSRKTTDGGKKVSTEIVLLNKDNKLQATVKSAYYPAYNAYEWTIYFKNIGTKNSSVLTDVMAADMNFKGSNPVLKGINGDGDGWYEPYAHALTLAPRIFVSKDGRATDNNFPYFNLETDSGGTMIAIGWPGTWTATFSYDEKGTSQFIGTGTNGLCTYLKPGETVRTPLMAFLRYYERNEDKATQLWRDWYIDCNMPSETVNAAEPMQPKTCALLSPDSPNPSSDGSVGYEHSSWKASFDKLLAENVHFDYQWYDAGWYYDENGQSIWSDWGRTGTLTLDKNKWPDDTFLEMTNTLKASGMKTLMWFEPERIGVQDFAAFCKNYGYKSCWKIGDNISNLGNPACLDWTFNKIKTVFEETGIDLYREDFNTNPAPDWQKADLLEGPFRNGITENKYIQGHLALWDKIIAYCAATGRSTIIDSCASGGRRNDLETMRRAVPFLRSDADRYTAEIRLSVTTTYMKWIPCNGTSMLAPFGSDTAATKYLSRVSFLPIITYGSAWSRDPNLNYDTLRTSLNEWKNISKYYYDDFYALTPWHSHTDSTGWTSWMYFNAKDNAGVLQVFRQSGNTENSYKICLRGVDDNTLYNLNDIDGLNSFQSVSGSQLKQGITITLANPASASVIYIEKAG